MKRPLKFPLKFDKGIRLITRKRTTREAMKQFKSFYLFEIREFQIAKWGKMNEALARKRLEENIEGFRESGFDQEWFERLCRDYEAMPRRARRKKVKIKFDANDVPKMTKTALDPPLSALFGYVKVTKSG
jgi:hypothetical protein